VQLRPITASDLPSCVDVFFAAEDALHARLNLPLLPRNLPSLRLLFSHITSIDPGLAWLAEDDGQVVAFGIAAQRGALRFLSFLFVLPEAQGKGLGRRLLERCLPADGYRGTCIEAIQPVSAGLYAAYGMVPRVPIYTLVGRPRSELPGLPAGLELVAATSEDDRDGFIGSVGELDEQVLGFTRPVDHRAWLGWQRQPFFLQRAGSEGVIGYGYAQPSGRLGPVVVLDAEHLLPTVGQLIRSVAVVEDWQVLVPGAADQTFVALLRAGLHFDGAPGIFCATRPGLDHSRYLPASFALP
jgi:GNAT superfamily N-acetyltransferase